MSEVRLLFVDDDENLRKVLGAVLKLNGFQLTTAASVPEALDLINKEKFDVLLSDLNVGEPGDGFTVVSAMRRVQPNACTFILTGYPDLETAIQAIRNQVDDYFSKPLKVDQLLHAISNVRSKRRPPGNTLPLRKISHILRDLSDRICEHWLQEVTKDPDIAAIPLSRAERSDHVPEMVSELIQRLESPAQQLSDTAIEAARKHGKLRYRQGYSIPQMLWEVRILQHIISAQIHENFFGLDLSTLVPDVLEIGESLQAEMETSVRAYQSQVPRSLQTSFSMLYQSPYLGVAIADESHIIDANDSFLRMIAHTREQLTAGSIDWRKMTPEKFHSVDDGAMEQLREFGTCVPYEKEFLLPDGSALPFLVGAARLSLDPLQWSAYIVDLTEQRKLLHAEQKLKSWEARHLIINRLAHELNNPLAAMTFSLHLLGTHDNLPNDTRSLLEDTVGMLDRISETVRRVLQESAVIKE